MVGWFDLLDHCHKNGKICFSLDKKGSILPAQTEKENSDRKPNRSGTRETHSTFSSTMHTHTLSNVHPAQNLLQHARRTRLHVLSGSRARDKRRPRARATPRSVCPPSLAAGGWGGGGGGGSPSHVLLVVPSPPMVRLPHLRWLLHEIFVGLVWFGCSAVFCLFD